MVIYFFSAALKKHWEKLENTDPQINVLVTDLHVQQEEWEPGCLNRGQ